MLDGPIEHRLRERQRDKRLVADKTRVFITYFGHPPLVQDGLHVSDCRTADLSTLRDSGQDGIRRGVTILRWELLPDELGPRGYCPDFCRRRLRSARLERSRRRANIFSWASVAGSRSGLAAVRLVNLRLLMRTAR